MLGYIRDISIILAGIGGLAFAVYRFMKSREAEANLEIDLSVDVNRLSLVSLVSVTITIRNLGKAAAYVLPDGSDDAICSVRKFPLKLSESQVTWDSLVKSELIPPMRYLADWDEYFPDKPFIFEPGAIDYNIVAFSTRYRGPIWVRAQIVDQDGYKWLADRILTLA